MDPHRPFQDRRSRGSTVRLPLRRTRSRVPSVHRAADTRLQQQSRELKAANARLTRLDSEKDDFLSQVSHEVRTPMTSIRSFAEILLDAPDVGPERSRRYLRIIHDESLRMTRLLDGILDLGVLQGGASTWTLAPIDAEAVLDGAIAACEGLAAARGVQLRRERPTAPLRVRADADRLSQVFINLIANAIKFNDHARPEVVVSAHAEAGRCEVLVQDNGPGIAPDQRGQLFSKFPRAWSHSASASHGAGLGLAISAQIMRRLDGRLELLDSAPPGACFRVSMPLCKACDDASALPGARSCATRGDCSPPPQPPLSSATAATTHTPRHSTASRGGPCRGPRPGTRARTRG